MRFIVLSILFSILSFSAWSQAKDAVPTLKIGDKAPDINVFKWVKGNPIDQFEPGQVYVVEFGATWCVPCRAAIPKLTELSRKYRNDGVTVASFFVMEVNTDPVGAENPAYVTRVEKYVEKQGDGMDYTVAIDGPDKNMENTWLKAAGKVGIPYVFVIDKQGLIAWIGSDMSQVDAVIQSVKHPDYDISSLIPAHPTQASEQNWHESADKGLDNEDVLQLSLLTKYQPGQAGKATGPYIANYDFDKEHKMRGKVIAVGESLRRLYYMAFADSLWNYPMFPRVDTGVYPDTIKYPGQRRSYGRFWYRPVLEVQDSIPFESKYGEAPNRYNYFLKIPKEHATAKRVQEAMQADLHKHFGYEVTVEKRDMPCWRLVVMDESKIRRKPSGGAYAMYENENGSYVFENGEVRDIIFQLEIRYGYMNITELVEHPHLEPPFIDATGITGKIDYVFDAESAGRIIAEPQGGPPFTVLDYKKALNQMGFDLVKGVKEMDVVVIRDAKH